MPVSLHQCLVRQPGSQGEVPMAAGQPACRICQGPIPDHHDHILDTERCAVLCACPACSEIFDSSRQRRSARRRRKARAGKI